MRTFFGKYSDGSFVYSEQNDALKAQLISILNTPVGSRFYAPTYGSHLNEYRPDNGEGRRFEMAGLLAGEVRMQKRLGGLGMHAMPTPL